MADLIVFAVTLCIFCNSAVSTLAKIGVVNFVQSPDSQEQTSEKQTEAEEIKTVISLLEKYEDEDKSVQVLGNDCLIFLLSDFKPASKFIYDTPVANMSAEVHRQFAAEWESAPPSYVVCDKYHFDLTLKAEDNTGHMKWVLSELENNYELIYEGDNYRAYRRKV